MANTILSILGIYKFDDTIFDNLNVPEGMNKDALINKILLDLGELNVVYSKPDILKAAIGTWSISRAITWERMWTIANAEYNPLENYDRQETWTDQGSHQKSGSGNSQSSSNSTVTEKVAGFNSESLVNARQSTGNGSGTVTNSESESGTDTSTRTGRIHGNIGVMSSQTMAEMEISLAPKLDIYSWIVEEFKQYFCIMVY